MTGQDERDTIVSVQDAALLLGITPEGVRKRLQRGQLRGRKVRGQWQVVLSGTDVTVETGQDTTTGQDTGTARDTASRWDVPPAPPPAVSDAARAQLEAIRDEWLAPLIDQIRALEREQGRLLAQEEQHAREVAALVDQVAERDAMIAELRSAVEEYRDNLVPQVAALRDAQVEIDARYDPAAVRALAVEVFEEEQAQRRAAGEDDLSLREVVDGIRWMAKRERATGERRSGRRWWQVWRRRADPDAGDVR